MTGESLPVDKGTGDNITDDALGVGGAKEKFRNNMAAFYTPPVVIKAMYEALGRLVFSQGNILEPFCGTGNFFGLLPESMAGSKLHGVEIDPLTGEFAKQFYQKAKSTRFPMSRTTPSLPTRMCGTSPILW